MWLKFCLVLLTSTCTAQGFIQYPKQRNFSQVALALSEIVNGLKPKCLTILVLNDSLSDDIDDFIYRIHKQPITSSIFFGVEKYFEFIDDALSKSIENWSLIFHEPFELASEIHKRNLAHRLSLFMFYWGAQQPPRSSSLQFHEPIRAVIITRPRNSAFHIYYNQAISSGKSNLRLVNWYDEESLGLYRIPLLPDASTVYSSFRGRTFYVPVIHSPPWHFVSYRQSNISNSSERNIIRPFKVIGGRDHHLLNLIATKMHFKFEYLDPQERTQGSSVGSKRNSLFTGGLGMIQNREAHFLFGDVGLSLERRKAAEFSFFTLIDSGAFATHAPRRLNEALAVVRPFQKNVWPYLILTVLLSGPVFYFVIIMPYYWKFDGNIFEKRTVKHHAEYINEITLVKRRVKFKPMDREIPKNLLDKCIWFTVQLFLKQSCSEPYGGARARFLVIVYWIAATYVLADVYSAQLTSLFARPARESPIDTLAKLEYAMEYKGYQLYIEKDSSVLQMLENSTEIFRRLYKLMKHHMKNNADDRFLINSIEEGIQNILSGAEKAILGGRETLYFNIKRYGTSNFQLSRQLYTRYSAVAVQIGCPFLESFNKVLMRLFESGIIDKITSNEYEKMLMIKDFDQTNRETFSKDTKKQKPIESELQIQPLNLRMLQGAFIILLVGNIFAGLILTSEIFMHRNSIILLEILLAVLKIILRTFCWAYLAIEKKVKEILVNILQKFLQKM